jgi:hypothetical protein
MKDVKKKISENQFNFIKKIVGLREDVLVKKVKLKDDKNEKNVSMVVVPNESYSYMVQVVQKDVIFDGDLFGIRDVKSFVKSTSEFTEMSESDNDLEFTSPNRKLVYRKVDAKAMTDFNLPAVDRTGYVTIPLNATEIKEIKDSLKNDLSDYASFVINTKNKLVLKIGLLPTENYFQAEIKTVEREGKEEIQFLSKLAHFKRFFDTLEAVAENKVVILLKNQSPFMGIEKNDILTAKTFIATTVEDEENDPMSSTEVKKDEVDNGGGEENDN